MDLPLRPNYRGGQLVVEYATVCFRSQEDCGPTAQDEVLEVLEMLLDDLFGKAITADKKARLRTLKDLDQSAAALAEACHLLLDPDVPDESLRRKVFAKIPRAALENALERVSVLIRPPDDVHYQELSEHYRSVRGYLPHVLTHICFEAAPAGSAAARRLRLAA